MIQIFLLGSSNVYGAGAEHGSWADLIKQALHFKMYSNVGVGDKYEVYNFGKSGAPIEFVRNTFPEQLKQFGRGGKIITVLSVGGNNIKAENRPNNFVSTIEEYATEMSTLLDMLKSASSHVIVLGSGFYDESKTNPKYNPLTGGKSYFKNERREKFESRLKELCIKKNIVFVDFNVTEEEWKKKYLFKDGLHPNQLGYKLISKKVLKELEKII